MELRFALHEPINKSQIELLAEECRRHKISALPLLEAYRMYLVHHLTAARCADDELQMPVGAASGFATPHEVIPHFPGCADGRAGAGYVQ